VSSRTITITLPEGLYERIRETAEAASLSLEEVLAQSIALSLPELEPDLPSDIRSKLAALPLLSDDELWDIANSAMDEEAQAQLEILAELQQQRPLTKTEQTTLSQLMEIAQGTMLYKAEAYRLLARRGHPFLTPALA
jgi:hypothetical protein